MDALYFPQGYRDADAIDQARLRTVAAYLLDRVNETGFFSFRDGNYMLALSMYALTGGPDKGEAPEIPDTADYQTIRQAMNARVDRAIANQLKAPQFTELSRQGYWCYSNNLCEDTPNTQFVAARIVLSNALVCRCGLLPGGGKPAADALRGQPSVPDQPVSPVRHAR